MGILNFFKNMSSKNRTLAFEEVVRLAVSLGGDADTQGCMAGAIAACMYPIPEDFVAMCDSILTDDLREIQDKFIEFIDRHILVESDLKG